MRFSNNHHKTHQELPGLTKENTLDFQKKALINLDKMYESLQHEKQQQDQLGASTKDKYLIQKKIGILDLLKKD